jgi:uncharacterized small protein (DUF1192 family)
MFDEDLEPKKKSGIFEQRNLEFMSTKELEEYILELQNEIDRVKEDISKKKHSLNEAESVFKN